MRSGKSPDKKWQGWMYFARRPPSAQTGGNHAPTRMELSSKWPLLLLSNSAESPAMFSGSA
eukprot:6638644-Karenia_brevis.AAC.1